MGSWEHAHARGNLGKDVFAPPEGGLFCAVAGLWGDGMCFPGCLALVSLPVERGQVWRDRREAVSPRNESVAIALPWQTNLETLLSLQPHAPAAHSSAQAQDRPTATVSPLRTQNSPSRLPAASLRPHSVVSPQHVHQPPVQTVIGAPCPRPAIPLTSAASAVTPPNVSAANLNGEAGGGPASGLSSSSPTNTGCKPDDKKNEKVSGPSWASPGCGPAGYLILWHQTPMTFCKTKA